ncbi:MAG TPA: response regulator transcription factor [Vicinamibacterales bacterium]|nr:response regulator transcription factor [Vicinamibacterales bacterium]
MKRVLLVEDNRDLAAGLRNNLEIEGYEVEWAADGPCGVRAFRERAPDLVVLDLMLPGLDGYRVLREMRSARRDVPVLVLTARAEEADKVRLLKLGADDYVTKPFGVLELLARIEALLRRAWPARDERFGFGDVLVDASKRTVMRAGQDVTLTPMEFDLLVALLRRRGSVASRIDLLTEVWGHSASVLTRTVDTHIAELRRKLERDPAEPQHILTVRKAGYRLE